MDGRTYHAINVFVLHHAWWGRTLDALETWSVPVMAIAIAMVALWLLDRPGGGRSRSDQRRPRGRRRSLPARCDRRALVGIASALLVTRLARPVVDRPVRLVERVTDPLLTPLWRLAGSRV